MIFLQGFIKFDQGISEKCIEQSFGGRKKKRRRRRIRNRANTICLTNSAVAMETKKGGLKKFGFLSSNIMKLCRNIHRSVWQLLRG
jgi:hypothetical protein